MKRWAAVLALLLSISLLFPSFIEAKANNASLDLKGDHYQSRSFAVKSGDTYYVNTGSLENQAPGIYKMSKNLKQYRLIKKGSYSNITIHENSFIVFNEDEGLLQQLSLDGKVIKQYPEVTGSTFQVHGNFIYYNTDKGFYQMGVNGKGNKLLYKPKGYVQEYTVHNGWLYFTYTLPVSNDPYDMDVTFNLAKIKIGSPRKEVLLVKNVNNIDSIIVRDGYIYSVIHKNDKDLSRHLYRMDYSGKNVKRISNVETSSSFIGSKHIYFVNNTFDATQTLFRMTVDGKKIERVGTIPGRKSNMEYYDGVFYLEVQAPKQYKLSLHRISI
ncbi:hypothetical protein OXB_1501 [Bacillus sp. OxB-1]|uniref:DUF5050 domain-containing protein n=1 Tax=Bacillus sp. (strain OxB-1) TaxID=98228 RepID=UPI000581C186|nr:DUF5050 domain-containing protein [Bacillus sp. OxB-1]BAQ09972.1 hypothetical protein OXB_1501 [Bacillus sp. OxB-1]